MNGADALLFWAAVPRARIYAFEAHTENFQLMRSNFEIRQKGIIVLPLAVTDYDGEADFYLANAGYSRADAWRGMSSLHKRFTNPRMLTPIRVQTTRLDTFLADKVPPDARLALWIDAEGKGYEVIDGTHNMIQNVDLVHVEVETSRCIGDDQMFYPQVKAHLYSAGFRELATDAPSYRTQFNALFVRDELQAGTRCRIALWLALARLRFLMITVARRVCPACVSCYRSMSAHAAEKRSPSPE
jgi:FkbM family methyltransferase